MLDLPQKIYKVNFSLPYIKYCILVIKILYTGYLLISFMESVLQHLVDLNGQYNCTSVNMNLTVMTNLNYYRNTRPLDKINGSLIL